MNGFKSSKINLQSKMSNLQLITRLSVLILITIFATLLLSACSSNPTTAPNPIQTAPQTAAGTANPQASNVPTENGPSAGRPPSASITNTPVSSDKRVVLTVWTSGWKGNLEYEKFFNDATDVYRKLHPEVTFEWLDFGNDTVKNLNNLFTPDPKAPTPIPAQAKIPDLMLLDPLDLYQFAGTGKLEDLKQMVGNDYRDRYLPNAWEGLQLGSASYGIPWVARTRVSIINKTLWQTAKLDPAKLPQTFDDLDQLLPSMKKNTPDDVWSAWVRPDAITDFMMEDTQLYQANSSGKITASVNNSATQGKWQYYADRRKDAYFLAEGLDGSNDDAISRFLRSKVVMWLEGGQSLLQLKAINADFYSKNTLVTLHPVSKAGTLPLIYQGWSIPKAATYKDRAVDFALVLANDDNQLAFSKLTQTVVPTSKKALTDPFFSAQDEPLAIARNLMATNLAKTSPPEKLLPSTLGIGLRDRLLNALKIAQSAMWTRKVAPKDALAEVDKAWSELLK